MDRCRRSEGVFPGRLPLLLQVPIFGVIATPRKPNYDFERRERERSKAAESAKKAQAKADKRAAQQETPSVPGDSDE